MSNRRKRTAPVRVDEETKKKLSWNMCDDLKDLHPLALSDDSNNPSVMSSSLPGDTETNLFLPSSLKLDEPFNVSVVTQVEGGEGLLPSSTTTQISLIISSGHLGEKWRVLLDEFTLQLPPGQAFPEELWCLSIGLMKTNTDDELRISVNRKCDDSESDGNEEFMSCVRTSLNYKVLEDITWLQKKNVIGLFQNKIEDCQTLKIGIYLLESGLGKPEFLSEGSSRMKKTNALMQKLMEYFYDLTIPENSNITEEADKERERENIEELYDFVRHAHQQETLYIEKVQHPLLVPSLREYQCQAVSWMLQREQCSAGLSSSMLLQSLRVDIENGKPTPFDRGPPANTCTSCMNASGISIIRECPLPSADWPGGILADEMGLGKTVEMLALILTHTRKEMKLDSLSLPEGTSVNYYMPPPLPAASDKAIKQKVDVKPKEKANYPSLRKMLITAIKEMKLKKAISVSAMYKYITATYRYDIQRNRHLIRKTLAKLIAEQMIEQVKGHGLAGSFRIGKNYKEEVKRNGSEKQKPSPVKNVVHVFPNNDQEVKREEGNNILNATVSGNPLTNESFMCLLENENGDCGETKQHQNLENLPVTSQNFDSIHEVPDGQFEKIPSGQGSMENTGINPLQLTINDKGCPDGLQRDSQGDLGVLNHSKAPLACNNSKSHFECICGESGLADYKARVQCLKCHLWQHASCVNYKEEDIQVRPFYCPHCLVTMQPVPTSATLIISPSSICHQWVDEINRHVRLSSISILIYQGVKRHGFIQPHALAKHEIVITTYDVLRSELNYVDIPHSNSDDGRRLRKEKRYMAIPSPLVAVEWWRICLDEAQMVECATAKAAEMCLRLSAINRWCVTGTPVQRSLEDLYGLVLFLGVDPYWVKHWWDQLLYQPYCRKNPIPMYTLIAKIMWRTAKKDVLDQIQIPPQTEEVHWLRFSPVERHFYHRQHEICSQDALQKLRKIFDWNTKLSSLDRRTVSSILYPLLRLRQACCHPQAVRGEFLPLQKSTMTMEELLKSLQKKCCTECEEAHRQLVCALNGLAGIHIIRGEFVTAVEYYREVLRSSEEHKGKLQTDSLQRLHATHNLIELLEANHPGIPPTLRDHKLREEAEQLRQHYMNKSDLEVSAACQALPPVQQNIRELQRKIRSGAPWWLGIIECVQQAALADELVTRVRNEISCNYKQQPNKLSMAEKFQDCRGLQFLLTVQTEELKKSQKTVQDSVKNLESSPSQEEIRLATVCHLRPVRFPLNNCQFCKADELFTEYESKLFSHSVKGQKAIFEEMIEDDEGLVDERLPTTSRGLWAASETERALKAILAFGKTHRIDTLLIEEGNIFMELLELWKKEYKLLHEYWMALRNRVSAIDELAMATERFQVRLPDEPKPNLPVLHIIESHEVEQNRIKLLNDKAVATSQLQKKLGQMLYLTNLEKSQDPSTGGVNPDPCPICSRQLGQQWAVLTCGHCFCNDCIAIIIEQYSIGARRSAIKCAICRQTTAHKEVSYVFTTEAASKEDEFPIKGSHSTKVEAVLRTLKKIQRKEPEAKALVFSTWQDVLDIIGKALLDNNMDFVQINGFHRFQENLSAFKYDSKINILLLPLHTASNGLNIIEATYVLLVEPILNLAHELQAIGRVHRIGQTKATVVHRFLIKGTIEERMQSMLKSTEKSHNKSMIVQSEASALTVGDLADLFSEEERTTDE